MNNQYFLVNYNNYKQKHHISLHVHHNALEAAIILYPLKKKRISLTDWSHSKGRLRKNIPLEGLILAHT
jgi:hypothetical protein